MSQTTMNIMTSSQHRAHPQWRVLLLTLLLATLLGSGLWWANTVGLLNSFFAGDTAMSSTTVPNTAQFPADIAPDQLPFSQAANAPAETGAAPAMAAANDTNSDADSAPTVAEVANTSADAQTTPATAPVTVVAVAGVQGTPFWRADGTLLATLESGAKVHATARTDDGAWLAVTNGSESGWVQRDLVIIFDQHQLTVATLPSAITTALDQNTAPAVPTVQPSELQLAAASDATAAAVVDQATVTTALLTMDSPVVTSAVSVVTSSTGTAATVATNGARLNVRDGANTDAAIIAKVTSGAALTVLGSDASGAWLQVQLTDDSAITGWVAADYVQLSTLRAE